MILTFGLMFMVGLPRIELVGANAGPWARTFVTIDGVPTGSGFRDPEEAIQKAIRLKNEGKGEIVAGRSLTVDSGYRNFFRETATSIRIDGLEIIHATRAGGEKIARMRRLLEQNGFVTARTPGVSEPGLANLAQACRNEPNSGRHLRR